MNDRVQAYLTRIRQWWAAQSPTKRWRIVALVVLAVGVMVAGFVIISSPDWQPLYTNLSARTAGQITSELTTMKVPYQLTDGGSTILVPKADVNQVRVSLADQNIPSSTVGLPSSLTFSLGESDQEIQLQELANLEATLESTIDSINGVRSSRVLINQPSPSLFGETTQESTASVFVDLAPGASLNTSQVRGIMNLVAHSVSGLSVNEVSVVDQNGTVLSASALDNNSAASQVSGVSGAELAAENAVSSEIRNNVQNMLDQVLGPGNAVVQVSAILNFNHSSVTSVAYGHAVLSSQEVQTSTSSGTTPPSPAVGTQGNTPTVTTTTTNGGTSKSNSRTTVDRYLVDTTKTSQVVPAGQIQRLTVAVVVDQKLSAKEAKSLRNLVANAAGVNFKAGDQVTVVGMPFNRTAVSQALAAMQQAQRAETIREGVLALLAVGAFVFLLVMLRRALRSRPSEAEAPAVPLPTAVGGQVDFQEPMSVAELLDEMRQAKEPSISERARQRLDDLARHDPETAARLLRAWMEEDNS
ncbi:MAG: flagellar basal-body MS-ring/collar protein FliF [Firmicutes bacterium]|nr:flagellar basal-body MS-ring/collar protein FliF [Bacillota bacterium]